MKKMTLFFAMIIAAVGTANAGKLYATFGTPGSNATYVASTGAYSSSQSYSNLMNIFTFSNGELANYTQLVLAFSNLTSNVRVNFAWGNGANDNISFNGTEGGTYFGNVGTKTITMSSLATQLAKSSKTLADITAIRFGGTSNTSACTIYWQDVYLEYTNDAVLTATYSSASAGGASYDKGTSTYSWTNASSNNLINFYTGSAGDFSKYSNGVIQFTLGTMTNGGTYRIGYHNGSTFTTFQSGGFGSAGTKTIALNSTSSNASAATSIKFGSNSNSNSSGSVIIRPDQMYLVRSEAYTREFTAGQKSTVWLPFALTAEEVSSAGTFYELTSASGGTLTFTSVTTTEAYKPYLFVPSGSGTVTPFSSMTSKTIVAPTAVCKYTVGDYTFVGAMSDLTLASGVYGWNSTNGTFSKTTSTSVTIAPFRAYITYNGSSASANARALTAIFNDGEATAIKTLPAARQENETIYNLAGQRVGTGHKGLVIRNGKKIVIK